MVRIILSIMFVIGAWVLFTNFTDPTFASIDALKAESARLDVALTKANELKAERTKLSSKFNLFSEEEKARLGKFLPETIDNVRLLIDIDRIAEMHNIRLSNITIQTATAVDESRPDGGGYGIATLDFAVSSTYDIYLAFIKDLERSLRLVDITEMSFASAEQPVVQFQLKIQTYWLADGGA